MTGGNSREIIFKVAFSLMIFSSLGHGAYEQCLTSLRNTVLYEGTLDTLFSCANGTAWSVRPTSSAGVFYPITNYNDVVSPTLTGLYAFNETGLIVRNATTIPSGGPISTAGFYIVSFNTTTRIAFKLVVIHSGPICSCTQSSSVDIISCTMIYADHPIGSINAVMNCSANDGQFYASTTPTKTLLPCTSLQYVYNSTSTITVNNTGPAIYDCLVTFAAPTPHNPQYLATNAPDFNATSTVYCEAATSSSTLTTQSTTLYCGAVSTSQTLTTQSSTTTMAPNKTTTSSTTSQYSNGSLTRKPINTAVVAGSSNIALECASSYGTDAISWSFTPLGSFSNQTIQISKGYKILTTNNQQYEVHATVNSSVLIVRQLSSLTEGTYTCICYDGVESTSALLLVIPLQISVEPLFGPIAGGTSITIIGSATFEYLSKYVGSPNTIGVREVYIGNDLSSTSVLLKPNVSSKFELVAVTPNTTKASIGQPLPVIVEFSPTPFNMTFNKEFIYLPNPEITSVYPYSFIVNGGTLLDVFGQSLSSVAKPIIQLTVVITRSAENSSTSNTSTTTTSTNSTSRFCRVPPGNDTYMQCPMPPLNIPDDFLEILNSLYNTSTIRRKREIKPSDANVLTVLGQNGVDRANICLGIIFDGYKKYENINDALPDTKFIFYSDPEINSSNEVIEFDPSEDEPIYVKGKYMLRGCRLRDYLVLIGNQTCINDNLTDNQLSCRPPKEKPMSTMNDTMRCGQHLSIAISLGYKQYQYACLIYPDNSKTFALIVGLTVGFSGFALFLTILIVGIVKCRRKKVNQENERHQNSGEQELRNPHYNTDVEPESPQDYIYTRENTISLYKPNDEYSTSIDEFYSNS